MGRTKSGLIRVAIEDQGIQGIGAKQGQVLTERTKLIQGLAQGFGAVGWQR